MYRGMARLLTLLLTAIAIFVAPVAMGGFGAHAQPVNSSSSAASAAGHCAEGEHKPVSDTRHGDMMSCASACSAVEPAQAPLAHLLPRAAFVPPPASHTPLIGSAPEGETPPPRIASET